MRRKRKPPEEILSQYEELKVAAGGSGAGGGGGGFRAGQNVVCRVVYAEPGGYAVHIPNHGPGFLPTRETLSPEQEISAQYVCMNNNRILLSRFGKSGAK